MAQTPVSRDYCVTSPQTHNKEVEWIRNRLGDVGGNSNVFGIKTFTGAQSGDNFGTELADASQEMKFRIGYPENQLECSYGQTLDKYLLGLKPLPDDYAKRKKDRKGVTAPPSKYDESTIEKMRKDAVQRAISKIGVKESPPESNQCFASEWYGQVRDVHYLVL